MSILIYECDRICRGGGVNCTLTIYGVSIMKNLYLTIFALNALLSGCSINKNASAPQYTYCAVAHISDPAWVQQDRNSNYLISKIGLVHDRESERDITTLVKQTLAQNLYSDVHAYSQSTLDNSERLVSNYNVNVATNVQLQNVKTEFTKVDNCLVAWASVSQIDADIALAKSHPINEKEHAAWQLIEASKNINDYKQHLKLYPQGLYADTAKARIDVLNKHYNKQAINRSFRDPTVRMLAHLFNNLFN